MAPRTHAGDRHLLQTYLIWSCPASGIASATDTFFYDEDFVIKRQNIAFTSST